MLSKNRLFLALTTAILITLVFTSFYTLNFSKEITGFFKIGDHFSISPHLNADKVLINKNQVGYDGQFFLTLALDPFLSNDEAAQFLDHPRYRFGRLLYPLMANLASFGNATIIPYTLVFLNGLSILLMVLLLSELRKINGLDERFAFLLLCIPGIWVIFSFSTSELLSSVLLIASFVAYKQERFNSSGLFAGLACLAKEVTFIFWFASFITAIMEKNRKQIISLLLSIIPFGLFRTYLFIRFSAQNTSEASNFSWPLTGHIGKFQSWLSGEHVNKNEYFFYIVLLFAGILLLSKLYGNWKRERTLFFTSLGYLLIFALCTTKILDYHISYNRVLVVIYLLVLLSSSRTGLTKIDKTFWVLSGLASARYIYWYSR